MTAFIINKDTTYSLIKNFLALFEKNQFNLLKKQQTNEVNKKLLLNKEWKIQIGIPGTVANRKYSSSLLLLGWIKQLYEILRLEARIRYQLLQKLRRIWFFLKLRKYREKFRFFRSRYNEIEIEYPKEERVSITEALANEKLIMEKYKELNAIKFLICDLIKITTGKIHEYEQLLEQYAKENLRINQINAHMIAQAVELNTIKNNFSIDKKDLEVRLMKLNQVASELKTARVNLPSSEDPHAIQQIDITIINQQTILQQLEAMNTINGNSHEKVPSLPLKEKISFINNATATLFASHTVEKIAIKIQQAQENRARVREIESFSQTIEALKTKALGIERAITNINESGIYQNNNLSLPKSGIC